MSEFIPTTEQVRSRYVFDHTEHEERAFDRWLAAHDAEVRASIAPTRVEIHRIICGQFGGPKTHDHTACENAANAVHAALTATTS